MKDSRPVICTGMVPGPSLLIQVLRRLAFGTAGFSTRRFLFGFFSRAPAMALRRARLFQGIQSFQHQIGFLLVSGDDQDAGIGMNFDFRAARHVDRNLSGRCTSSKTSESRA